VAECIEIVRFRAKEGSETALVDGREAMLTGVRDRHPGLVRAELARLDDGLWLDVLHWRTKAEAEAANADGENIPGFVAWVANVDEVLSLEITEVVAEASF